jgi:hypothetical protein
VASLDQWTRRYEQARAMAMASAPGGGWGLALLCRRGVVAWMRAWPDDEPAPRPHAAATVVESSRPISFDPSLRDSLVYLMAGMILHSERRASA